MKGRTRQVMVDTDGRALVAELQRASVQDRDGAVPMLCLSRHSFPFIIKDFADAANSGDRSQNATLIDIEIAKKPPD